MTKPSHVKENILQIRFIPQNEDMTIENKIWLTPNFVVLCHWVGNRVPTDFMMPCLFMYFCYIVLRPEYLVILLTVNKYFKTFDWLFNFIIRIFHPGSDVFCLLWFKVKQLTSLFLIFNLLFKFNYKL